MSKLNKTAVAVLVALGSSAVAAGTMGPVGCVPGNVTTPCESNDWNIEASALLLQPIYDANFGYESVTINSDGSEYFHDINQNYRWGFEIAGSYHWGFGSDFVVNWYHLSTGRGPDSIDPIFVGPAADIAVSDGTYQRSTTWNAVNFEFGQTVDPSCHKWWRFTGGAQYAQIKTDDTRFFPSGIVVPEFSDFHHHVFNGFGPRGSWDATYFPCGSRGPCNNPTGFGLSFHTAAAILVGRSSFYNQSDLPVALGAIPYSQGAKTALVPELEAKLALTWISALDCGTLGVDLGWMWFNYFNANHNLVNEFGNETNFGAQGPYLTVNFRGHGGVFS